MQCILIENKIFIFWKNVSYGKYESFRKCFYLENASTQKNLSFTTTYHSYNFCSSALHLDNRMVSTNYGISDTKGISQIVHMSNQNSFMEKLEHWLYVAISRFDYFPG